MASNQVGPAIVPIKYIGNKDYKTDTVNKTSALWRHGETRPYQADKAAALLAHKSVWVLGDISDLEDGEQIVTDNAIVTIPVKDAADARSRKHAEHAEHAGNKTASKKPERALE